MKSIKQWMYERGMISEDVDAVALSRYHGAGQVEIDQTLRRELRPKVERIMDMDEYKSMSRDELLTKIKTVVSQLVAGVGGRMLGTRGLADKLSDEEGSVDKSKFARMMGSERLEVDSKLRSELKPKIDFIMDMEEYKSMPKSELEQRMIAVVEQLVSELKGSTMSLGAFARKMNSFEDEPVAQESFRLPSFLRWVENDENQGDSTSDPQHEEGEDNMDLKAVVEKRMMQMAMELESDGKGSRQEVLAAMKAVVDSASKDAEEGQDQSQGQDQGQGQPPQDGQQTPQGGDGQPAQQPMPQM